MKQQTKGLSADELRAVPPPYGYHIITVRANLGRRVKELREHHRYYKRTFAKLIGVSDHYVRSLEAGRGRMPRIDTLIAIANVFHVSVNYLISDAAAPYPVLGAMENLTSGNHRWE